MTYMQLKRQAAGQPVVSKPSPQLRRRRVEPLNPCERLPRQVAYKPIAPAQRANGNEP